MFRKPCILLLSLFSIVNSEDSKNGLRIGGIFSNVSEEIAFRLATHLMSNKHINDSFLITPETYSASYFSAYDAYVGACDLLSRGIIGLFGPSSSYSSSYIQSVSDMKEIPHIETHWDVRQDRTNCLVNLHPHPHILVNAFSDLIITFQWHKLVIIYENDDSLSRVGSLLHLNANNKRKVIIRKLEEGESGDYRRSLMAIKKTGETNFILDCSIGILETVLIQMQQVGMMTEKYNYIVTNLDLQFIDLSPFKYGETNLTGFTLVNKENYFYEEYVKEIASIRKKKSSQDMGFSLQTALTMDAIQLFYETIHDLSASIDDKLVATPISCSGSDNWNYGLTIINYMKRKTINGLTGLIKFDHEGFRKDFTLEVVELTLGGVNKIGDWNSTSRMLRINRMHYYREDKIEKSTSGGNLFNRTFIIITCLTPPYGMLKETTTQLTGNDRFEGFGIDVIQELSMLLGFNYTIKVQEDGANGNLNRTTGEWNGMIREVIDERADLAIVDLTVTSERESAVDFTMPFMNLGVILVTVTSERESAVDFIMPFMNLGISILYRKPEPVPPSLFMFASPFSLIVWVMLGVSYCLVSMAFFVMGRLSPSEWQNPYPCIEEPEYLVNQFSFRNCLWFTIGALMQQGSELEPKGISVRCASGVWWFFTLIMVSSYTANLAAFLTVETLVTSFKNIDDLARQTEIKYGAKKDGATANFFRDSNVSTYRKIWSYMAQHPEVMTLDNDEGVNRVETENYAYLMESTSIEYVTERHCKLGQVGNLLDDKGYGIAMKKDSPYRNDLSTAVLKLQESGRLTALKIKWWKEKRGGGNCAIKSSGGDATPLDLKNVGGVFMVLFVGSLLGLIGSFIELALHIWNRTKKSNMNFKEELKKELKIVVNHGQNVKEVNYDNSDSDNNFLDCEK